MNTNEPTTGEIPFSAANAKKPCKTWYKIFGDLANGTPLITLHGGPGAAHEYLLPFADLHAQYNKTVIFYDQIGCGQSTRLREKEGDEAFWSVELFINELDNLIDSLGIRTCGFDLLGQSWGGMLAGVYASRRPTGLRKLVLANAPASIPLTLKGMEPLFKQLPVDVRKAIEECHRDKDFDGDKYKEACMVFYRQFVCRSDPWPAEVNLAFEHMAEDPTVYGTMYGPSEFHPTGSLRDWVGSDNADKINVPTLLVNGRYDEVQDVAVAPWFEKIPKVKWIQLAESSHIAQFEERERYMLFLADFLDLVT